MQEKFSSFTSIRIRDSAHATTDARGFQRGPCCWLPLWRNRSTKQAV